MIKTEKWDTNSGAKQQRILTDTDPTQKRLFNLFGLDTYAPQR